ncbi:MULTISPECIES: hypothetical protein [Ramlibacter]|uniref:Lipoprotein n=1 Tax=Ramlibacter pinisoli TaxID=2682844 RepID=A0A6N8IUT0_9BURK|nr:MULTISPECIES: hypothetical protein [Ramlibacter]MBA2965602.1 hypothetical protein [Ramlibacter sp. CGMCC 1.13660]MVQ30568.1 hypothetical protein [Ramlibacter pinisoli]
MPRLPAAAVLCSMALAACSPTFNWRDVRIEPAGLRATLPCKPEQGARRVPLAGRAVEMAGLGCDAGGATFAILHADLGDPALAGEALAQWNRATLANMKAGVPRASAFVPPGAVPLPASLRVVATGQRADGSAVQGEAAYFVRGSRVVQAVVYADELKPQWVQPFFDGLAFE